MTGNMSQKDDFFSENDAFDINDLASLNEDISAEFIEQLQNNISLSVGGNTSAPAVDDSTLFEDIQTPKEEIKKEEKPAANFDPQFDDNFIKKYQAKIRKQKLGIDTAAAEEEEEEEYKKTSSDLNEEETVENSNTLNEEKDINNEPIIENIEQNADIATPIISEPEIEQTTEKVETNKKEKKNKKEKENKNTISEIENLTSGNIIEKPISDDHLQYNESLDYLDDNVKYSKYVIYIDPENTEFMESLTVKERKNLINRIIREQDDIAITKKRLNMVQAFIKHSIIAIITIALAIPIIYHTINASLEASINNYRRSQSIFKTLYKEKGKIQKTKTNTH